MAATNFSVSFLVDNSPQEAFNGITNVRGWWSEEIEGSTDTLNSEFKYHYEDVHRSTMKIIGLIPGKKVVWLVEDNYFKFTKDTKEWTGDKIVFDITEEGARTKVTMTQHGLVPEYECYDICSNSWTNYMQNSLYSLITTGKGMPNGTGKPQTENEKKLSGKD